MKHSQEDPKPTSPAVDAVMRFVDDEMAKIVADIGANRPERPAGKPRSTRAKAAPRHAAHAA
jgi:hypothetical protein